MCLFKNKKKYKITFQKTMRNFKSNGSVFDSEWTEITDFSILKNLCKIQEYYDFEIISTKIQDSNHTSQIIIKCRKEDKNFIFFGFCSRLEHYIENVSIK